MRTSPAFGGSSSSSTTSHGFPASHITAARVFTGSSWQQNVIRLPGTLPRVSRRHQTRRCYAVTSLVAVEDQAQADQCQIGLVVGDGRALLQDEGRQATGGDDHRLLVELGGDPADDAVDLT